MQLMVVFWREMEGKGLRSELRGQGLGCDPFKGLGFRVRFKIAGLKDRALWARCFQTWAPAAALSKKL